MKKTLTMALVGLFLVLMIAGCMRLNRDTGVVELTPFSLDRQSMNETASALDQTVPEWLLLAGSLLSIPGLSAAGLLWRRLRNRNLALSRAEAIGGDLVMNIQAIRQAAAEKQLTLDEINQLLTTIQTATPEVIQFVEQVKRELNVPPVPSAAEGPVEPATEKIVPTAA